MASTFKNSVKPSVSVDGTICYTAPALTTTTVIGLSAANTHSTEVVYVDVSLTDVSQSVTGYMGKHLKVPTDGSIIVVGGEQKLVLEPGDYITVKASLAASVDVIASVLEVN